MDLQIRNTSVNNGKLFLACLAYQRKLKYGTVKQDTDPAWVKWDALCKACGLTYEQRLELMGLASNYLNILSFGT